jgi:hypothetical protein
MSQIIISALTIVSLGIDHKSQADERYPGSESH